jgi:uncharacterized protein YbjT (DUF2867 family)
VASKNLLEEAPCAVIRNQSKIYTACGVAIPFISAIDIAAVAFRALTDPQSHNRDHRILGPELPTYDQIAEKLPAILGRRVKHWPRLASQATMPDFRVTSRLQHQLA